MTLKFSMKKVVVGMFVAIFLSTGFVPLASAQTYYYTPVVQAQNTAQIQALLNQIYALIAQLQALQVKPGYGNAYGHNRPIIVPPHYGTGSYDVEVSTEDYDVENDDTVTLSGRVDLDDAPYADVWFEYGTDSDLDDESDTKRKTTDGSFDIEVDNLDEDEQYYFRAVAEDPSGGFDYGSIKPFDLDGNDDDDDDDNNDGDTPDVTTDDAEDIGDDTAELHGEIDMNDFDDGLAFFVYGEDEGQVDDVSDENRYNDIDEDGDDLQKIQLSTNVTGNRTFWATVYGLNDDTEHFFRICVEYEDEDGDDTLECGDVENFTTDEN